MLTSNLIFNQIKSNQIATLHIIKSNHNRNESVQANLHGLGRPNLSTIHTDQSSQLSKVHPSRRQTQRSGGRGQGYLPSHILRDARYLVLW